MSELSVGQLKGLTVNNNVMTVPSGHTLYAPGHVVQIVHSSFGTQINTSTSTLVDTGLTATITPKFSSSKILVLVTQGGVAKLSGSTTAWLALYLYRNSTQLERQLGGYTATNVDNYFGEMTFNYLDSPETTSSTVYKVMFASVLNSGSVSVQNSGSPSHITLMEIAQ
jgi:hypothetical protein